MVIWKCTDFFRGIFGLGGGGVKGRGHVGGSSLGEICHGRREIPWRGAGFSSIISKKKEKINMKKKYDKVFSTDSKDQH